MGDILQIYLDRKRRAENYAYPHWSRAIDNYKHYLGRLDVSGLASENDYPFSSRLSTSISYEMVETVMPRLIGKNPEFSTIAIEPDDAPYEANAKVVIDYEYNNPKLALLGEPIYLKLQKLVKENLITGNAVARAFWRRQTVKRNQYYGKIIETGQEGEYREIIKKAMELEKASGKKPTIKVTKKLVDNPFLDDFDIIHVPFFFFYPDAEMVEPGRMRYQIERSYGTFEQLVDEAEFFNYDKNVLKEIKEMIDEKRDGFTPDINKDFLQEYKDIFRGSIDDKAFENDSDKINLLIIDKMWEGNRVHVIVNEKYVLTGEKGVRNPYDVQVPPFIYAHDVLVPHSYYGRSEIDAIKRIEDGINDMMNMRTDNLIQSMLNIWLINPNYFDDPKAFAPVPNATYYVKDVARAVNPIKGNDVTASVFEETRELYQFIQRISGVNDYVKGIEGEKIAGRTYGGLRLVQEMANARFIVKSRLFETVTLTALGYFILELSRQFITKDRRVRLIGKDYQPEDKMIKASDLKSLKGFMDIKVIPNSSRAVDEQAEAIKLNNLYDRMVAGKGPFTELPDEIWDAFLLKWLPKYGVNDALYWIRAMRKAREKNKKLSQEVAQTQQEQQLPYPTGNQVIQSDQVAGNQPNPIEKLINSGI